MILISWSSDDGKDVDEDVDDVQVQVKGGEDVLFRGDGVLVFPAQHQLSVVDEVKGEQKSTDRGIHQGQGLGFGQEYHHDTWKQIIYIQQQNNR